MRVVAVFDQYAVAALTDSVPPKKRIRRERNLDIACAGHGVAGDANAMSVPNLECVSPVGDCLAVGGDEIVGDVGVVDAIEVDAIEDIFEATMAHDTVMDLSHPNRSIEADRLLSAVRDGEILQGHIGAGDCDDRSGAVSFDVGGTGYADEGERFVDVEIAPKCTTREVDHCPIRCLIDGFLEGVR